MKPYYETELGKLYHGDARELFPIIHSTCIITDPVWPNSTADIPGKKDPFGLLKKTLQGAGHSIKRIAIHLGGDSDPRFLTAVPDSWPFFRVVYLRYIRPNYKGRILYNCDIAYLFGDPPKSIPGQHLIPGYFEDTSSDGKQANHPCPRKRAHVGWLVKWWTEKSDIVLDPFFGSGTTAVMCEIYGRHWVGIEISEEYCEIAAKRIEQETKQRKLF